MCVRKSKYDKTIIVHTLFLALPCVLVGLLFAIGAVCEMDLALSTHAFSV